MSDKPKLNYPKEIRDAVYFVVKHAMQYARMKSTGQDGSVDAEGFLYRPLEGRDKETGTELALFRLTSSAEHLFSQSCSEGQDTILNIVDKCIEVKEKQC